MAHTHYPHPPKRTIKYLPTSLCFPRSLADPFPQWCPDLRRWAIVKTGPLIAPWGLHSHTSIHSLLTLSLSLLQHVSPSLSEILAQQLEVIAQGSSEQNGPVR